MPNTSSGKGKSENLNTADIQTYQTPAQKIAFRFVNNSQGFWQEYWLAIIIFSLAVFADGISTASIMAKEGISGEIHIPIRMLAVTLGPVAGPVIGALGKVVAGLIVGIYCRKFAIYIFSAAAVIGFWATWYNIWGRNLCLPNPLEWLLW